ncbi:BTAD domain-containing putative transcriptional regulator [Streptomyces cinereoruber]|uniref:BTAD domain-containing putative transcriptional regulator n=1 Tax=Streptomyces cinereoruber TaxID=67260 RepID=UPI00363D1A4F
MPTPITGRPGAVLLGHMERQVLSAVGCGLRDGEIAAALALSEESVAECLARILVKLGLRDRAAAIVHAFDSGLVAPGHGPRARSVSRRVPQVRVGRERPPGIQISVLGPLRAWRDGRPLGLGHPRQQAVLAALALDAGRTLSRYELLDGIWGTDSPAANVVPVYVYRLRGILRTDDGPDTVIEHDRQRGYRLVPGTVDVDLTRMEKLVADIGAADREGDAAEAVRLCSRVLGLFRGEPLEGLPGPLAELERVRLGERRIAVAQWKAEWQLRLGRCTEAVAELSALSAERPWNEPVAALLMRSLYRTGRQAEALAVFDRTCRRLADDLGVAPSMLLRRTRRMILCGDETGLGRPAGAGVSMPPA